MVDESVKVAAPADVVWRALVDPAERAGWWAYLELDAVRGGRFLERWTGDDGRPVVTSGAVVEVDPGRRLGLTWADEEWPSETYVTINIDRSPEGTHVRVRHTGFDRLPSGDELAAAHAAGWRAHLEHLAAYVDRGR